MDSVNNMKWTDEPQVMRAFDLWITNGNGCLGDFVREIMPYIPKNDTTMLFVTFAKFSHLYTDHRNRNPHEELALSFHRSLNTLMEEESTRNLFSRMAQAATNAAVGHQ